MGGRGGSGGSGGGSAYSKMPELSGSEKQVSWAKDIRGSALSAADANVRNAEKFKALGGKPDPYNTSVESAKEVRSFLIKAFQGETSAKAIIDRRDRFSQNSLVRLALELDAQKRRKKG